MMETLNTVTDLIEPKAGQGEVIADQELRILTQVLAPYAPFTAEAGWQLMGGRNNVHSSSWPAYDPDLKLETLITIPIQINGKLRGTVDVSQQATEAEIRRLAEAHPGIVKYLNSGEVIKVIYVPGRTMNFVVK